MSLSDAHASEDGAVLSFTLVTSSSRIPLRCAAVDIGEIMAFFGHAAKVVGEMINTSMNEPNNDVVPIPITGIGFQEGPMPDTTLLLLDVSRFRLAFEVPSSALAGMADDIVRIARTLSAEGSNPQ
jgi:hypothetical protein